VTALDVEELAASVPLPDEDAREQARAREDALTKPQGSLGRLEELAVWLCGVQGTCPPRPLARPRVVVFAADHGVAGSGVSAFPPDVTAQMLRNFVAGGAAVNVLARRAGATVRVVDMGVEPGTAGALDDLPDDVTRYKVRPSGRIDVEDALTRDEAERAFSAGVALADAEVDSGADLLVPGDMGIGNTTPAAVLTAVLTGSDVVPVIGRGTGIDDATWMRKAAAVRDARRRARHAMGDPLDLLATAGGADFAAMTGFLVEAAVRRTPVVLDGVVSAACALVAQRIAYRASLWWIAGHRSPEPAQALALERLDLVPVVDLGMRLGEGSGALVAVPVLAAAADTLADMATFAEAGVSDREHDEPEAAGPPELPDAT